MRALIAAPFGFLIGLSLGALGSGGSILAVPVLVYVAGETAQAATTISLLVVGLTALVGMARHLRAGRVRVGAGIVFGVAGIGGSFAGSAINRRLDPDVLLLAFSALIMLAAWRMLTGCPTCTKVGEERATGAQVDAPRRAVVTGLRVDAATVAKVVVGGTVVGFLTGLFGVGGGFIIVPALTLLLAFPMPSAIGTSLLVIAINCAFALTARAGTFDVDWGVAVPFTIAALAGVLVGSRVADRLPAATLLTWFAGLLVVVATYTAVRSVVALV